MSENPGSKIEDRMSEIEGRFRVRDSAQVNRSQRYRPRSGLFPISASTREIFYGTKEYLPLWEGPLVQVAMRHFPT